MLQNAKLHSNLKVFLDKRLFFRKFVSYDIKTKGKIKNYTPI